MNRRTLLSLLLLVGIPGCSSFPTAERQEGAQIYGLDIPGKQITFVLDTSGSMENREERSPTGAILREAQRHVATNLPPILRDFAGDTMQKNLTKLASAKRALATAVMNLPETSLFQIVTFSDGVSDWKPKPIQATTANKSEALSFISGLRSAGRTSANQALIHALAIPHSEQIVFISDGVPTDASPDQILLDVERKNIGRRVSIHTVGLGTESDNAFLQKLAERSGGKFAHRMGLI